MFRRIRSQLNPASALAVVALFASLGGVSYAAATIGTSDIKNGAVNAKKLKKNAVTSAKIKANAVTGAKVKESSLSEVPKAASATSAATAATAATANTANTATSAGKANLATNSEQLGGSPAASFGSGIVGAAVTAAPAIAGVPSFASGSPIGSGDYQVPMPVPAKAKNLFVKASGDLSRPFVVKITNGEDSLVCGGVGACFSPASVVFETGDMVELTVLVTPGPAFFGGATYQVGYQLTP